MLKVSNLIFLLCCCATSMLAGINVSGKVYVMDMNSAVSKVSVLNSEGTLLAKTNKEGYFEFVAQEDTLELVFYKAGYAVFYKTLLSSTAHDLVIYLIPIQSSVPVTVFKNKKEEEFDLKHLQDVEGTTINAGRKTEVVVLDGSKANLATNNARQIYSHVAGLNIYQNDDGGLQLNVGGRGLDPNRTSNFNTKQNGYDISADVLGYPESYYTPPAEALKEIQIIRGAASLQYGTQFGGLINFIIKEPIKDEKLQAITRNTIGSYGLFTNFTSLSGTHKKVSYYTYVNYKRGDGFRENSQYESFNTYAHLGYQLSHKTKISTEISYLDYISKQGGGLSDKMFATNPFQSNRDRNWFKVNWLLLNLKLTHDFNKKTKSTLNLFKLHASRYAIGYRSNRVEQQDDGSVRDLIKGDFSNYGLEARVIHKGKLLKRYNTSLLGLKFYKSHNLSEQGPGSAAASKDFSFKYKEYENYSNQSHYIYPNLNLSLFGENIFYLSKKLSLTPGFRAEFIQTESEGFYKKINTDAAGNVILNQVINNAQLSKRSFILLGLGTSWRPHKTTEIYSNLSQNYRSVTFTDISIVNPAFAISPNIKDEKGYTADLGIRGTLNKLLSYDLGVFAVNYKDRIGFIQKLFPSGIIKSERGNVGNAIIYGMESLVQLNLAHLLTKEKKYTFTYFLNTSLINSRYTSSRTHGIVGNKVELVPHLNLKTGINLGYKSLKTNLQYTYLSSQFSDASNAVESNLSGVIGIIPSYHVLDLSLSYTIKRFTLETGANNALNQHYYTRRATGYPGPGIIPSIGRNLYFSLQIKI